jgi:hypothetical protein
MHPMNALRESPSATPILDSGVLPSPRPKKRTLGVIIGFVIGILFAPVIGHLGDSKPKFQMSSVSILLIR